MDEADRYWCHVCSQMVNPIIEVIEMKCPVCLSGFIEEMGDGSTGENQESETDLGSSDRSVALWAPILLGMMSNPRRRRRSRQPAEDGENDNAESGDASSEVETELDRQLQSFVQRRRRSSLTILQMLQQMRAESTDTESEISEGGGDRDRERASVILINPFNQTIIVQGSFNPNQTQNQNENHTPIGSLGDYFIGPGLELLLQHLAETDPNRYGTPPAKKEAIEAMPTVKIDAVVQCSVCLDDFELESEAKEMPCKHKFHEGCITPWLELHSSCPVCRYQLPSDETKLDTNEPNSSSDNNGNEENGNESGFSIPWPFSNLFSSSTGSSQTGNGNNSSSTS